MQRSNLYNPAMKGQYYIYIVTNSRNTVLYTGVTNNLARRIYEHKQKFVAGFTFKYQIDKLVYYEIFDSPEDAIYREKQLKGGSRTKKINLITSLNPQFEDLYLKII